MKGKFKLYKLLVVAVAVLTPLLLHAQDSDDDDDDSAPAQRVYLTLQVDLSGQTKIYLNSPASLASIADVRQFFVSQWNCAIQDPDYHDATRWSRLSREQQARIENFRKESATRNVHAECSGPLRRSGLFVDGRFDLQPLLGLLRRDGIEDLFVSVSLPKTKTRNLVTPSAGKPTTLRDTLFGGVSSFDLPVSATDSSLEVSFGYSRRDLIRLGAYTSLFVIVPLLIVLVMRTAALRRGADDPAAAWFSFMQTMQVCLVGTFLLWGTTPLNTRGQLSDLLAFLGWNNGWRLVLGQILVFTVPTWGLYVLSTALSYKVFVKVRNVAWTWTQFMTRQLTLMGRTFFPLTLYIAGMLTVLRDFKLGMSFMGLGWLSTLILAQFQQRLGKNQPSAITSGPLRDRIFALAQALGVKVRQVLLVPAAESGVANAFATTKQTVVFTDYLIDKLTQREVDAVAAHELTHLRYSHAQKLSYMIFGVVLLPGWILGFAAGLVQGFLMLMPNAVRVRAVVTQIFFSGWTQALVLAFFLWLYYVIRRKFEYTADAGSVAVTRDPEAMITALVKLSRLNLTPLQWSRRSESMLTHPSTMRRLERIAQSCGMPESHLRTLIGEAQKPPVPSPQQSYVIQPGTAGVVKTGGTAMRAQRRLLYLVAMHLVPAAAFVLVLHRYFPAVASTWWALLAGALVSVGIYQLGLMLMSRRITLGAAQTAFKTLGGKTGAFKPEQGIPVGFAPGSSPRFFVEGYNWDHGLLFLSAEKLVFVGSHCSLGLTRDQIRTIVIGEGAPSWLNWKRVYCSWEDRETGRTGSFNLLPLDMRNLFQVRSRELYLRLRAWRNRQGNIGEAVSAAEFLPPNIGAVTSMSAKDVNKPSRILSITVMMVALALGLATLLKLDNGWYLSSIVLLIRVFEGIPHWRYRERPMVFDAANAPPLPSTAAKAAAIAPPAPVAQPAPQPYPQPALAMPSYSTPPPPKPASSPATPAIPDPVPVGSRD